MRLAELLNVNPQKVKDRTRPGAQASARQGKYEIGVSAQLDFVQ